jgi:hypothetical protein
MFMIFFFNDFHIWAFVRRACGATSPDVKIGAGELLNGTNR